MSHNSTDAEKLKTQIKLLIAIDTPMMVISAVLSLANDIDIEHLKYLCGPVFREAGKLANGEETSLPKWLVKTIYLERLDLIFEERENKLIGRFATPAEVLAVLNTIFAKYRDTGEMPFENHGYESIWYEVQIWCFQQSTRRFDIAQNLKTRVIEYAHIQKAYEVLAREIRKNVIANSRFRKLSSKKYARKQA